MGSSFLIRLLPLPLAAAATELVEKVGGGGLAGGPALPPLSGSGSTLTPLVSVAGGVPGGVSSGGFGKSGVGDPGGCGGFDESELGKFCCFEKSGEVGPGRLVGCEA